MKFKDIGAFSVLTASPAMSNLSPREVAGDFSDEDEDYYAENDADIYGDTERYLQLLNKLFMSIKVPH